MARLLRDERLSWSLLGAKNLTVMVGSDAALRHVADEKIGAVGARRFSAEMAMDPSFQTCLAKAPLLSPIQWRPVLICQIVLFGLEGVQHDRLSQVCP
jgi:hypothetical protein